MDCGNKKQMRLEDAVKEKVPRTGWREVSAKGKSRVVWDYEAFKAAVDEYFDFAEDNPLTKDVKLSSKVCGDEGGEDGNGQECEQSQDVRRQVTRPYNMRTLLSFLGIRDWDKFKTKYCVETTDEGQKFAHLCAQIENFICGSLQEGATAGIYNAKMVMGLTDVAERVKQEVSGFDDMSDEELRKERDRLLALARSDS